MLGARRRRLPKLEPRSEQQRRRQSRSRCSTRAASFYFRSRRGPSSYADAASAAAYTHTPGSPSLPCPPPCASYFSILSLCAIPLGRFDYCSSLSVRRRKQGSAFFRADSSGLNGESSPRLRRHNKSARCPLAGITLVALITEGRARRMDNLFAFSAMGPACLTALYTDTASTGCDANHVVKGAPLQHSSHWG